jgi:ABC-type transporter MlaC component
LQEAHHLVNKSAVNNEVLLTGEDQRWKSFNNFEKTDHKALQKLILKDEITNIAMRIVKAREAK